MIYRNLISISFFVLLGCSISPSQEKSNTKYINYENEIKIMLNEYSFDNVSVKIDTLKKIIDLTFSGKAFADYKSNTLLSSLIIYKQKDFFSRIGSFEIRMIYPRNKADYYSFKMGRNDVKKIVSGFNECLDCNDRFKKAFNLFEYNEIIAMDELIKGLGKYEFFEFEGHFWDLYHLYILNCTNKNEYKEALFSFICLYNGVDVYHELNIDSKLSVLLKDCGHDLQLPLTVPEMVEYVNEI